MKKELLLLHQQAKEKLAQKHKQAWEKIKDSKLPITHFVNTTSHLAATAALAGTLITAGSSSVAGSTLPTNSEKNTTESSIHVAKSSQPTDLLSNLLQRSVRASLPDTPQKLSASTSQLMTEKIKSVTSITAVSSLDGHELNSDYGLMGAEQHLARFPGDAISKHDEYQKHGMTARGGAFGYLAKSENELSQEDIQKEKYYVAVQTFISPGWNKNSHQYKEWIKHRKVLVVNPNNGKAVVAVVADVGPAKWTGKQFGGSPEVVYHVNNGVFSPKTTVLLLFVDDPENKVPLGPIS